MAKKSQQQIEHDKWMQTYWAVREVYTLLEQTISRNGEIKSNPTLCAKRQRAAMAIAVRILKSDEVADMLRDHVIHLDPTLCAPDTEVGS